MLEQHAGQPGRAAGWEGCGCQSGPLSPRTAPHTCTASLLHRSSSAEQRSRPLRSATAPGGGCPRGPAPTPAWLRPRGACSSPCWLLSLLWGAEGLLWGCCRCHVPHACRQRIPSCPAGGTSPLHPQQGQHPPRTRARVELPGGRRDPALGAAYRWGRGPAPLPAVPRDAGSRSHPGSPGAQQHRGAGLRRGRRTVHEMWAGSGTERLEVTIRVWAAKAQQSPVPAPAPARPGRARGSSRGSASALSAWFGLVLVSSQC